MTAFKEKKIISRIAAVLCAVTVIAAVIGVKPQDLQAADSPFSGTAQSLSGTGNDGTEDITAPVSAEDTNSADSADNEDTAQNGENSAEDTAYTAYSADTANMADNTNTSGGYREYTSAEKPQDSSAFSSKSEQKSSDSDERENSNSSGEDSTSSDSDNTNHTDNTDSTDSDSSDSVDGTDSVDNTDSTGSADNTDSMDNTDSTDSTGNTDSDDNILADDASHADTSGNTPTDGGTAETEYFDTSIVDGESVENAEFEFTITHLLPELTVKRTDVYLNGDEIPTVGSLLLSQDNGGENKIRIAVTYTDTDGKVISAYREYTVYLAENNSSDITEEIGEPEFVTDLKSQTRSDPTLDFFAYVSGSADSVKITVYHKNKKLESNGGNYSCTLDMGINSLRIKAEYTYCGEKYEFSEEYEVKLIAETTPETAPYLSYHNVPKSVKGTLYTLDLSPVDYLGGKLYYSDMTVRLNGKTLKYSWDGDYTSYLLNLSGGENTLDIRITDSEGRYSDYSFVIECTAVADGEVIGSAEFEIDANVLGLGTLLDGVSVEIRQGESAAQSLIRALEENGFTAVGTGDVDSGYYLAAIEKDGIAASAEIDGTLYALLKADSEVHFTDTKSDNRLGEKQYTTASGWMISVNGHYTSYGTSDLHLQDGDKIRLRYTLAYGKDIGGYSGGKNYDVIY